MIFVSDISSYPKFFPKNDPTKITPQRNLMGETSNKKQGGDLKGKGGIEQELKDHLAREQNDGGGILLSPDGM